MEDWDAIAATQWLKETDEKQTDQLQSYLPKMIGMDTFEIWKKWV